MLPFMLCFLAVCYWRAMRHNEFRWPGILWLKGASVLILALTVFRNIAGLRFRNSYRAIQWLSIHTNYRDYPRRAPQCRMLTPVFHPNFDDSNVCIGDFWAASEGLDDLVVRIGRMIATRSTTQRAHLMVWRRNGPRSTRPICRSILVLCHHHHETMRSTRHHFRRQTRRDPCQSASITRKRGR